MIDSACFVFPLPFTVSYDMRREEEEEVDMNNHTPL